MEPPWQKSSTPFLMHNVFPKNVLLLYASGHQVSNGCKNQLWDSVGHVYNHLYQRKGKTSYTGPDEAIHAWNKALKFPNPTDRISMFCSQKAMCYHFWSQYENSWPLFEQAISNGNYEDLAGHFFCKYATALIYVGQYQKARDKLQKAVLAPQGQDCFKRIMRQCFMRMHQYDLAKVHLLEALQLCLQGNETDEEAVPNCDTTEVHKYR
jgi:tetratricopeptide (TPR) repeat protein